jgi:hypothetical protein
LKKNVKNPVVIYTANILQFGNDFRLCFLLKSPAKDPFREIETALLANLPSVSIGILFLIKNPGNQYSFQDQK